MKKLHLLLAVTGVFLLLFPVLGGCAGTGTARLKVVTTTSLLEQIVERVAGNKVEVVNIIPPSQCPGHFDVKPGDIRKLSDASLFLMHGWQGEMFTGELITSADNTDLVTVIINAKAGENINWMAPPVQKVAVDNVVAALIQVDSVNKAAYEKSAAEYKGEIDAKAAEVQARIAGKNFAGINVICNEQLMGLVLWMGLNLITTYGRPEDLTPQTVKNLIDIARMENVTLFIDNLQSGAEAAAQMVEELGCRRVTFTNFPGGYDDTETWEKAIDYDIDLVLKATGK